jgi:hypothetical protein
LFRDASQHRLIYGQRQLGPHLVCLLRQARGCCGSIRSSRDPHGAGQYMLTPTDAVHRLTGVVIHHGTSPSLSGHSTFIKEDSIPNSLL